MKPITNFKKINTILPNEHQSWNGKLFLTFDIDWANDEVIQDCYDLVSKNLVDTTWFVTHETKLLSVLASDSRVELGIHPNFNDLLAGKNTEKTSLTILRQLKKLIPTATSVRSHSLTHSERLIDQFVENGLERICNLFIPYTSPFDVAPYCLWNGAILVPHRFQDNVSIRLREEASGANRYKAGLHVFDFHPIHVFLNTESLDRYERTRPLHNNPKELLKHRYDGYGTRNRLIELLNLASKI